MPPIDTSDPERNVYAPAKVRAKMYVTKISRTTYGGEVELQAVTRGKDNAEWAQATPNGSIKMTILNEIALGFFTDPGLEFYVDFTLAPKGQEG